MDKEVYAELIYPELIAFMDDVLFQPLFIELISAGVQLQDKYRAKRFDEYGKAELDAEERENASDWTPFPEGMDSLGVPRIEMPQIRGHIRPAVIRFLRERGIGHVSEKLLPSDLMPTQSGYWPSKVVAARQHKGPDRPILASRDHYILDGHHQWLAAFRSSPSQTIPVLRFAAGIKHLLPIAKSMPSAERQNFERSNASSAAIRDALRSGRLWYASGAFGSDRGFNAALSRELRSLGAKYDPGRKVFTINPRDMPLELKSAVDQAAAVSEGVHAAMIQTLEAALPNVTVATAGLRLTIPTERILRDLNAQFNSSVKGIEAVTVSPTLQPAVQQAIVKGLTENLDLYITKFAAEQIPELRRMVEANLRSGARLDKLAEMIEERYGVSERKAAFLARQESGLFSSKFRMERAINAGSNRYIWNTRKDQKVRHDHAELNGTVQFWSNPPIVNKKTAKRAHPGEDFECRCWPTPIIELPKKREAA